ncbi:MAG TPA: ATP-binding protein [Candidatus Dormibacteraeota bacterium]|jgi:signal transduction histidine kinase/CHASE3 domain sensor protein|nr:ATP-binding protein [Candidatus Dormibacteraeota bacterium]
MSRLSLRSQSALLLAAVLVVVSVIFAALGRLGQATADLSSSAVLIQAFDNANHDFDEGMLVQETGVRGYALTADKAYLQPYHDGRTLTAGALKTLDASVRPGAGALLTAEVAAARAWQGWAASRIAYVAADGAGGTAADVEGKRLFDAYRNGESALDRSDLNASRSTSATLADRLRQQQSVRGIGWLVVVLVLVFLSALIFRSILRPLERQARFVTALGEDGTAAVPGLGRHDEVGRLATALAALQRNVHERRRLTEVTMNLSGQAELSEVLDRGLSQMIDLLDAEEAICTVVTDAGRRIAGSYRGLFEPGELVTERTAGDDALTEQRTIVIGASQMPPGLLRERVVSAGYQSVIVLPLLSGGEPVGTVACLRRLGRPAFDVADAARAEVIVPFIAAGVKVASLIAELREANLVKSRFLANMSHELRTPLNAILGFSQVLTAADFGPLNERQQRYVGHIENSGRRLLDLINDILDLAKVEAGLMEVHPETIELAPVLLESRSEIERQVQAKGLSLTYDLAPGLWVHAEARRLQQVVLNLLSNAIKFTPEGGTITVTSTRVAGDRVEVTVADTGLGIAAEDLERIFDEFAQVDSDALREQRGTGLGLSLSRRLAELMDGSLTVTSVPGEGSRFTLGLRSESAAAPPAGGVLVLVVEDEAPNRDFLSVVLEDAGYRTVSVDSVDRAVRAVRREPPAAVLLDILLPDQNGWSLVDQLKGDPATSHIPIVVVTAIDAPTPEHAGHLAAFFTKPVEREALLQALGDALAGPPPPP